MVVIQVGNVYSTIKGELPSYIKRILYDQLSYSLDGYTFSDAYRSGYWDGKYHLFNRRKQSFLTGLLSYVREILQKYNVPHTLNDIRQRPIEEMDLTLVNIGGEDGGELWEHQLITIERAINRTRGVFEVSTGGGKTTIAAGIIAALNVSPFVFFVLNKDLMYQAQEYLERVLRDNKSGKNIEIGIVGDGKCQIRDINVVMIQSAVRALGEEYIPIDEEMSVTNTSEVDENRESILKLLNECKGWYFDECQHLSAPTAQLVAKNTPNAYYRYGGSATPYRDDGADILIEAVTGRKFVSISASYLIRKGVLMKPVIHIIPIDTYDSAKKEKDDKHKSVFSNNYNSIYKHFIVENEYRNNIIARIVEDLNSQNLSAMVLVKHIKHGNILHDLIPRSEFIQGNTPANIRQELIDKLRNKEILCLIATTLADEGLDIKTLNAIIIAGSGKSSTRAFQRIGRVLRIAPGKKNAIAVDFYDKAPYLRAHSKRRLKLYESEEEFEIVFHK